MSKFTPAPWSWVIEADGRLMITHNGDYLPPTIENADLIVAAPEMHDDLCEVAYFLEQKSDFEQDEFARYAQMIRETLAKADGKETQS